MSTKPSRLEKTKNLIAEHWLFILFLAVFTVVGVAIASTWYKYQVNPDAISYFSLAEKYAHLDIRHAINGYWGPLLSWLLAPAVWLGLSLIVAAKIIGIICADIIFIAVYSFLIKRSVPKYLGVLAALALAPVLVLYDMGAVTPDILMATCAVLFTFSLTRLLDKTSLLNSLLVGITGALMYFSKGFGFYLFWAITLIVLLWDLWQTRSARSIFKKYAPAIGVFLVLTLPFIAAISAKYGQLTINNAGDFDHHLFSPASRGTQYPMLLTGPLAPPNPTAYSSWEDPTNITPLIRGGDWSPLDSAKDREYFLNSVLLENYKTTAETAWGFGALSIAGAIAIVLGAIRKGRYRRDYVVMGLVASAMIFGYCLVYMEARYIEAVAVLTVTAATLYLSTLKYKWLKPGLLAALFLVAIAGSSISPVQSIIKGKNVDKDKYQLARHMNGAIPKDSNVISDDFISLYTCYYLDLHCYSVLNPPDGQEGEYLSLLNKFGIKYYIAYHPAQDKLSVTRFANKNFTKVKSYSTANGPVTLYELR
jgi:hypothetical protein